MSTLEFQNLSDGTTTEFVQYASRGQWQTVAALDFTGTELEATSNVSSNTDVGTGQFYLDLINAYDSLFNYTFHTQVGVDGNPVSYAQTALSTITPLASRLAILVFADTAAAADRYTRNRAGGPLA